MKTLRLIAKPLAAALGSVSAVMGILGFFGIGSAQVVDFMRSLPAWAAFCIIASISFATGLILGSFVQERADAKNLEAKDTIIAGLETDLSAAQARVTAAPFNRSGGTAPAKDDMARHVSEVRHMPPCYREVMRQLCEQGPCVFGAMGEGMACPKEEIGFIQDVLLGNGYADYTDIGDGERWSLTPLGRDVYEAVSAAIDAGDGTSGR